MTQVLVASTVFGAMTLASAVKAGLLGDGHRRVLVVSNNAPVPEVTPALDRSPAFAGLAGAFDDVVSWNDVVAPMHPSGWSPRADDALVVERLLRQAWGLDGPPDELVVESVAVRPAQAVATVFATSPVCVYSDGLMSYGPTRSQLPQGIAERVTRLLHLDLVPGLRPLLLSELGTPSLAVPDDAFTATLADVEQSVRQLPTPPPGTAMMLGQYLSALGVLTDAEEEDLHVAMLTGLAAAGHRAVAYKAHPGAPPALTGRLVARARALSVDLHVLAGAVPAETWFARLRPAHVVGCFSTALLTAQRCFGLEVSRVGTKLVLERLTPYQNSNRVPLVLADATLPALDQPAEVPLPADQHQQLLHAVGYCMQPRAYPHLRADAERYLSDHLDDRTRRYFRRRRLTALDLPGGARPGGPGTRVLRSLRAHARRSVHRTTHATEAS